MLFILSPVIKFFASGKGRIYSDLNYGGVIYLVSNCFAYLILCEEVADGSL